MTDPFSALADPTRRRMLELLRGHERPAGDFAVAFPRLTQPAVSRHLRVLREAGLVLVRPEAQQRLYRLCPDGLAEVYRWLAGFASPGPPDQVAASSSAGAPERRSARRHSS